MFDAISFAGYKSFSADSDIVIHKLGKITVFIGKNNCGKSSALDMVGAACDASTILLPATPPNRLCRGYSIPPETFNGAYIVNPSSIYRPRVTPEYYNTPFWSRLKFSSPSSSDANRYRISEEYEQNDNQKLCETSVNWYNFARALPRHQYKFIKLAAERNIIPEPASNVCTLSPNGEGATNLIRRFINNNRFDESLIERTLLEALNSIMANDAQFEGIRVQECRVDKETNETIWEVYLQEKGCDRFPLSQSGSGLKTIVLVLLNLLIIPTIQPSNALLVYGFEELENNLHPALQRRLFDYLYRYAIDKQVHIFLTTHSHVAINLFYEKAETALYHVVKDNGVSSIKHIESYMDKAEILDDLDVKASDLLQANGIIWVEGPSDRIYIKRWLEVFGGTDVHEGKDFQFAYYGGRLLSHYSTEETTDLLNILLVNRNSAIVMDSDKRSRATSINATKKRIQSEFQEKRLFSWITKGKEIENYLTVEAIRSAISLDIKQQCDTYELFPTYIAHHYPNFTGNKVRFANTVKPHIDASDILDLKQQVTKLYETVKQWNR